MVELTPGPSAGELYDAFDSDAAPIVSFLTWLALDRRLRRPSPFTTRSDSPLRRKLT
jgi:hypothetical protein